MESVDINVVQERQKFIEELKKRVDIAFHNRVQKTYIEEVKNTKEDVEKSNELGNIVQKLADESVLNLGVFEDDPNQVSVDNPHDYGSLLEIALKKLVDEGYFNGNVEQTKNGILKHEFEHHVPALDQPGLKVKYAVSFIEDESGVEDKPRDFAGIEPAIFLSGSTQVGIFRDVVGSVREPSATDKALLNKK